MLLESVRRRTGAFSIYAVTHGAVLAIEHFSTDGSSWMDRHLFDLFGVLGCRADGETRKRGQKG
jgi:hypothetical protein